MQSSQMLKMCFCVVGLLFTVDCSSGAGATCASVPFASCSTTGGLDNVGQHCVPHAADGRCVVNTCTRSSLGSLCCLGSSAGCQQVDEINCKNVNGTCTSVATSCQLVPSTSSTYNCCTSAGCAVANTNDPGCASPPIGFSAPACMVLVAGSTCNLNSGSNGCVNASGLSDTINCQFLPPQPTPYCANQ